ncbi:MAG: P-loop NTPase fold protein [Microgenomates group bacterium]
MVKKKLNIGFLKDTPILKNDKTYYDFYHKYIAPTLHEIIQNGLGFFTIGLFGPWGSGKSTIVENLAEDYKSKYPVFIFDTWKYKGDPLRRTFLTTLRNFIEDKELWKEGQAISEDELDDVLNASTETREQIKKRGDVLSKNRFSWFVNIIKRIWEVIISNLLLFGLLFFGVSQLLLQLKLGETNSLIHSAQSLIGYISESTALAMIVGWVTKTFVEKLTEKLVKDLADETKTQTLIKKRDYLNSPEQFEKKFKDIIRRIKGDLVVVFDNIDRVQGDSAINILSSVRTFLDVKLDNKVVFIIPCDSSSIETQIKKYYSDNTGKFDATEYLRKIFGIVVTTPDFISTDLDEYSTQLIKDLDNGTEILKGQEENLLRVVTYGFKSSPRAVKQFLNNFAATILIAYYSDGDVWSEVSKNLAYLAKIQILKQKFPDEYINLRDNKIFDPENIEVKTSTEEFKMFMLQTSTIKANNAKPFIFFKIANSAKKLKSSNQLTKALIDNNIEESKQLITINKKKSGEIFRFIIDLYQEYRYQPQWLTNVVKTFISVSDSIDFKLDNKVFLDRTTEVVERDIWQEYKTLDTNRIFELFISDANITLDYRKALIGRYISALYDENLTKERDHKTAIEILTNLTKLKRLDENFIADVRSIIEQSYSLYPSVISVFDSNITQDKFISPETLTKFINGANYTNFREYLGTIKHYSEFIKTNNLSVVLLNIVTKMIKDQHSQQTPDLAQRKELILGITDVLINFGYLLENSDETSINALASEMVTSCESSGNYEEREYFLPILLHTHKFATENSLSMIKRVIGVFVANSKPEALESSITRSVEAKVADIFINTFLEHFLERSITRGPQDIESAYELMSDDKKIIVIENLINKSSDAGIAFFKGKKLPDRLRVIRSLINRIVQFAPGARRQYYAWLSTSMQKNDPVDLKNTLAEQILGMICSDQPDIQIVGYEVLSQSDYLGEEQKQEVGRKIVNWLSEPQRRLNANYENSLRSVLLIKDSLSDERLIAYVKQLFETLNRQDERQTIDMTISIIEEAKLPWNKFKDYYLEFKNKLNQWTNLENQQYISEKLLDTIKNNKLRGKDLTTYKRELKQLIRK